MSLWESNKSFLLLLLASSLTLVSCKKSYWFEVNEVTVAQPGIEKNSVKSSTEFISIAYTDVTGKVIPQEILDELNNTYLSIGDKKVFQNMMVKLLLSDDFPDRSIPSDNAMRADVPQFVENTFKLLYNRYPNDYEQKYFSDIIQDNPEVSSTLVFYSLMTSDEYRQY